MHGASFAILTLFFLPSVASGDASGVLLRPSLRGAVPDVDVGVASSIGLRVAPRSLLENLNDIDSATGIPKFQRRCTAIITTIAVVEDVNGTDAPLTNESDTVEQPTARHYLCRTVFGLDHHFLRKACSWAGSAQPTTFLFNEDTNETDLFQLFSHMETAEGTGDGTELAEEVNDTAPVLTTESDIPEQAPALHYLCKAVFDRGHRFLHTACWRAGGAQSTAFLIEEDMNMASLLQVITQNQEAGHRRNASVLTNESNNAAPVLTSGWHFPRHPIARHFVCKDIFRGHRFLRHLCWWSGR